MRPIVLGALLASFVTTNAARADDAIGMWQRGDGNTRVRVASCGQAICATNIWVRDPQGDDRVGDILVLRVRATGADRMAGTAHDPQRNLDFDVQMSLRGQRMLTKGCVAGSNLCRDIEWIRMH